MLEEIFPTARHTVRDFSLSAVRYMAENLPLREGLEILSGSTYEPNNFVTADVQVADVGDLTATRWNLAPYRSWLDHTFTSGAKAVVITDIAGRLLHLHRATYSGALESPVETYEEYLEALEDMVFRRYGYKAVTTFYHRWSAITVFFLDPLWSIAPIPCPATPIGLEILK
jgi:hypothetical protein